MNEPTTTLRLMTSGAVRVKADADADTWKLEVLGVPYGRDADGETFTPKTDLWLSVGEQRPAVYYHGLTPDGVPEAHPQAIGVATFSRRDARGVWFEVALNRANKWAARVWRAALDGMARASTGALAHLVRVGGGGGIEVWPVGELSVFDAGVGRQPANQLATAVPLKALFDDAGLSMPGAFAKAIRAQADAAQSGQGGSLNVYINEDQSKVVREMEQKNQTPDAATGGIDLDDLADALLERFEQASWDASRQRVPAWRCGRRYARG